MLACEVWLRADALLRFGFHLEIANGRRWAVRGTDVYELELDCACGPDVCPPHTTMTMRRDVAA